MNSVKTLFFFAILAGIGYGVYLSINTNPVTTPPPGAPDGWAGQLNVEMPGSEPGGLPTSITPVPTTVPAVTLGAPGGAPLESASGGSLAPSFAGVRSHPYPSDNSGNTSAPPYAATTVPGSLTAPPLADPPAPPTVRSDPAAPHPDSTATAGSQAAPVREKFALFLEAARKELDRGNFGDVHLRLSSFYNDPRLSPSESRQLTELLDQVAGTVIYSQQHILESPYKVQPGDSLEQIAQSYHIPWQLLAKINGIPDPQHLTPGQELKVVRGPFNAVVDLDSYEMTLMLNGRYAGRFPIGVGNDRPEIEGSYAVKDKTLNPTYYGPDRVIEAGATDNPLGARWIGLGSQVGIHGTSDPQQIGRQDGPGSIRLGNRDIGDVFDILSVGSRVVIRR